MKDEERKIAKFFIKNGYLTSSQFKELLDRQNMLHKQGIKKSLVSLVAESLKWKTDEVRDALKSVTSEDDTSLSNQHPDDKPADKDGIFPEINDISDSSLKEDMLFARELLIRGITPLEDINKCLRKKYESKENIPLLVCMVREQFLSLNDFIKIKKEVSSWSDSEIKARHEKGPKLEIREKDKIPFLEQVSGFQKIGRYEIIREIGRGGMGIVYLGKDENLGRLVAIKTLQFRVGEDSPELERFQREAKLAASLNHPGIVAVHEFGVHEGVHFFSMDYVNGLSLSEYVENKIPDLDEIIRIIREVSEALAYAHSKNIIHRDIKPANILIDTGGMSHITDFGLARDIKEKKHLTISGVALGTPAYMPPEQAAGRFHEVNKRSDIYSLGAVLYHMLVGRPPFLGANIAQTIAAVLEQEPVSPRKLVKGLSRDIETICLKCLEKDPKRRYPNARALSMDLERFTKGEIIHARPAGPLYRSAKWIIRNKTIGFLFLLCIAVAFFFTYTFFYAPGTLTIVPKARIAGVSKQIDATFKVNDIEIQGALHKYSIRGGYHNITILAKDYYPLNFSLKISAGEELNLEKELTHQKGKLNISSLLSDIETTLTNKENGETYQIVAPVYNYPLDTGTYEILFKKRNYFPEKKYITVTSKEQCTVNVKLDSMLLWRQEISNLPNINAVHVVDLNQDGELELICSLDSGTISSLSIQKPGVNWTFIQQSSRGLYNLEFKDVNRDGVLDIIVGVKDLFLVLDGKTRESIFSVPSWWGSGFIIKDANGDGYDDFILFTRMHGIQCYDFKTKQLLWDIPIEIRSVSIPAFINQWQFIHGVEGIIYCVDIRNGKIMWKFPHNLTNEPYKYIPYNIKMSSLKSGKSVFIWCLADKGIFCTDLATRELVWHWKHRTSKGGYLIIQDLNGDGQNEVLIHLDELYCLDAQTGKLLWQVDTKCKASASSALGTWPAVGDIDQDGICEVVVGNSSGEIYIIKGDKGTLISQFILQTSILNPILIDIDGDGILDILFSSGRYLYCIRHQPDHNVMVIDDVPLLSPVMPAIIYFKDEKKNRLIIGNKLGELCCFDVDKRDITWNYNTGQEIACEVEICDINRDKQPEIIVPAGTKLYVLNTNGQKILERELEGVENSNGKPLVGDMDNDGSLEVILTRGYPPGWVYCLSAEKGDIIWKKEFGRISTLPALFDLYRDKRLELVISSDMQGAVMCIDAKDCKTRWTCNIPMHTNVRSLEIYDIDQDGSPEILVPQMGGFLSCIDGRKGTIKWGRRLRGGNIIASPILSDFDGDGKLEVIVMNVDVNINCLDAKTGKLKWSESVEKNRWASGERSHITMADIDEDGFSDIIATSSFHSFYFFSGKDGRWLGHTDKFGIINSPLKIADIDGDGKADIAFVDIESRVVCILDAVSYFKRIIKPSQVKGFMEPSIGLARIERLLRYRAYDRIDSELAHYSEHIKDMPHVLEFYKGVSSLWQKDFESAMNHFIRSNEAPGNIYDNKFLLAMTYLTLKKEDNARPIFNILMKDSIMEFDKCYEKYSTLIPKDIKEKFRALVPEIVNERDFNVWLDTAYQYAIMTRDNEKADKLLCLLLKYGTTNTQIYKNRYPEYLEKVMESIKQKNNTYHMHESLDILDEALENVPDSYEFFTKRAQIYAITGISLENALSDIEQSLKINPQQPEGVALRAQLIKALSEHR